MDHSRSPQATDRALQSRSTARLSDLHDGTKIYPGSDGIRSRGWEITCDAAVRVASVNLGTTVIATSVETGCSAVSSDLRDAEPRPVSPKGWCAEILEEGS